MSSTCTHAEGVLKSTCFWSILFYFIPSHAFCLNDAGCSLGRRQISSWFRLATAIPTPMLATATVLSQQCAQTNLSNWSLSWHMTGTYWHVPQFIATDNWQHSQQDVTGCYMDNSLESFKRVFFTISKTSKTRLALCRGLTHPQLTFARLTGLTWIHQTLPDLPQRNRAYLAAWGYCCATMCYLFCAAIGVQTGPRPAQLFAM